ncbi:MAG: transcription antitermination factor NusB [Myxococcota bacterium]|nr:transcription antitermination factor NusB [Myxococcota bacterium]
MGRLNPGRLAAGGALRAVVDGAHVEDALDRLAPKDSRDRGLAWHLALGALRHRGEMDACIQAASKRSVEGLDAPVRAALRVASFEIRRSRTSAHAAVHQGVELVAALGARRAKGFANAVLRRVGQSKEFPATINHPDWLIEDWTRRFGAEPVEAWCRLNDTEPVLCLVFQEAGLEAELRHVEGLELTPARSGGRTLENTFWVEGHQGSIETLPGFESGAFWVMDPSAVLCADLLEVEPGDRVLDVCAAPGGKSLRLAAKGAQVLATDRSGPRLRRLEHSVRRTGIEVESRVMDWESSAELEGALFDGVLVDAPCTGLGTTRRHPEIRWRVLATDPAAMALRQARILKAASTHVREGGLLVYSVCSPMEEEGSAVVRGFLDATTGYVLEEEILTAPPQQDEDAFFAAKLRRVQT